MAYLVNRIAEIERRARNRKRTGTVKEVDNAKGLARVLFAKPNGRDYLSPWLPWKEIASGGIKSHIPPTVGEQVDVVSESGDITDAVIDMSTPSTSNPRPHNGPEAVITKGGSRITIGDGSVEIIADVTIRGSLDVVGGSVTHNGKNIGDTHEHAGVIPGGGTSGPPV
ncbi:baseplate assembly protein [Metarhizobium album]|uniref:Baseplate assembly protein n=2 Tax=Metarhizobium album TaxID=2182425 RepID=A0A2U2DG80_9HYPH|nr:baseplate assembly protein [Rhizobium album]